MIFALTLLIAFADCIAICQLTEATKKQRNINAEKALSNTQNWYCLNIILLVIGSLSIFINVTPVKLLAYLIWAAIRIYMLCKLKAYMRSLEEYLMENQDCILPKRPTTSEYEDLV